MKRTRASSYMVMCHDGAVLHEPECLETPPKSAGLTASDSCLRFLYPADLKPVKKKHDSQIDDLALAVVTLRMLASAGKRQVTPVYTVDMIKWLHRCKSAKHELRQRWSTPWSTLSNHGECNDDDTSHSEAHGAVEERRDISERLGERMHGEWLVILTIH